MKKIIFPLTFVGILLAVSCSDEDELPTQSYIGCQTCEVAGTAPNYVPEDYEACVGLISEQVQTIDTAGNVVNTTVLDTFLFVNGANTGLKPAEYFSLYCDNAYDPALNTGGTGGNGGGTNGEENCVICDAYNVLGVAFPQIEVCQGEDGNAYVGGTSTGVPYNSYVDALEVATNCH